ncbi:MAG TPA: hypothetical protein VN426_10790 [Syntrophomonadaceae bacterium]|nr:hypothetical protein [Syntrophomonadaceae bacterium]
MKRASQDNEKFDLSPGRTGFLKAGSNENTISGSADFLELLTDYKRYLQKQSKSSSTVLSYLRSIKFYVRSIGSDQGGNKLLTLLTLQNITWFQSYLINVRHNRISSIGTRMSALSSYSEFLIKRGLLRNNPVLKFRIIMKAGVKASSFQEPNQLMVTQYLRSQRFSVRALRSLLIIQLIYRAGLSPAEISRLDIQDVLWKRGLPRGLIIWKGRAPRLVVIKDKFLSDLLNLYLVIRNLQVGTRLIKGRSTEEQAYHSTSIVRMLKSVFKKAGSGEYVAPSLINTVSILLLPRRRDVLSRAA